MEKYGQNPCIKLIIIILCNSEKFYHKNVARYEIICNFAPRKQLRYNS